MGTNFLGMNPRRRGLATSAIAIIAVVIVVIAGVGAYVLLAPSSTTSKSSSSSSSSSTTTSTTTSTTSTTSTTQSSSVVPAGCVFSASTLSAFSTVTLDYTGCLTSGTSGTYLIESTDPDGLNMTGTVTSQYPVQISIGSAKIGTLLTSAGIIYTANDTTSASINGLTLLPSNGYGITIKNEGGQNNTVTLNFSIEDIPGGGL
jgi:hypothetical protein